MGWWQVTDERERDMTKDDKDSIIDWGKMVKERARQRSK